MSYPKLPRLQLGNLEPRVPIIQGGMGVGISLSGLASAVAEEGGIGVISATGIGMLEPDFNTDNRTANERALRREIRTAREKTRGIVGVNILVALTDYLDLFEVAVDEGIDVLFLGAGLPLQVPESLIEKGLHNLPTRVVPIVSSARAARLIFQYWAKHYGRVPDGVVVEGPLAGGHLGFNRDQIDDPAHALDKLVPEVITALTPFKDASGRSIPVIAAGGIYDGADIYCFLGLGARGVQMATRFVATRECDASESFKQSYLDCTPEELTIIDSPVGLPGRAIRNAFLEKVTAGIRRPSKCPWQCLRTCDINKSPYCICAALTNAKKGFLDKGFAFAGANAFRLHAITTVKELIGLLVKEYAAAATAAKRLVEDACPALSGYATRP
jgi:nitronate monooxygenase